MNPLQVLQGVHAKVEGRGRTERLTGRGRGQGGVKVVRVAAGVGGGAGGNREVWQYDRKITTCTINVCTWPRRGQTSLCSYMYMYTYK